MVLDLDPIAGGVPLVRAALVLDVLAVENEDATTFDELNTLFEADEAQASA